MKIQHLTSQICFDAADNIADLQYAFICSHVEFVSTFSARHEIHQLLWEAGALSALDVLRPLELGPSNPNGSIEDRAFVRFMLLEFIGYMLADMEAEGCDETQEMQE